MSRSIETSVEIEAPARDVWAVLMAFDQWPDWNPFIVAIEGKPASGEKLSVTIAPPGGHRMGFRPTVLVFEPERALIWRGRVLLPGLFDGEHRFELEVIEEGRTRFIHGERFRGILVPLIWNSMQGSTRAGFEAMNQALKSRVEGRTR